MMARLNYSAFRKYLLSLKYKLHLHLRNLRRTPTLRTPEIESTEYIWKEIFQQRIYAHPHLEIGEEPLDVVLDVGANVGVFAAWVAQEYAPKSIYCYEASPITFRYLQRNLRRFGRMYNTSFQAIQAAVSDIEGEEIQIYHRSDKIAASTLLKEGAGLGGEPHKVRTTSLSHQLLERGIDAVDLLKIDVEGHYMPVLQGISDFSRIRRIVLECDWVPQGAVPPQRVVQFLEEKGYSVVVDDPSKENNITVYARQTRAPDGV